MSDDTQPSNSHAGAVWLGILLLAVWFAGHEWASWGSSYWWGLVGTLGLVQLVATWIKASRERRTRERVRVEDDERARLG